MSSKNLVDAVLGGFEQELKRQEVDYKEAERMMTIAKDIMQKNPKRIYKEFGDISQIRMDLYGTNLIASVISKNLMQLVLENAKKEGRKPAYTDFVLALRDLRPHVFPWD